MSSADHEAVPGAVAPQDWHVAAAALALGHAADNDGEADEAGARDDVILAAENVQALAKRLPKALGVRVVRLR